MVALRTHRTLLAVNAIAPILMCAALVAAADPPPPAAPPPPPPLVDAAQALETARVCWTALDVECAERALLDARTGLSALAPTQQLDLWRLTAEMALTAGRRADARAALDAALALDPRFAPPMWNPEWRAALDGARAAAPDRLPPVLTVDPPRAALAGEPLVVDATAVDRSGVASVMLFIAGHPKNVVIALQSRDGVHWRAVVPATQVKTPDVRFWIEATDLSGRTGRADNPAARSPEVGVHIVRTLARPTPITERWWFWTAVGVVVTGVTVGLIVGLSGTDADAPTHDGLVPLIVEMP